MPLNRRSFLAGSLLTGAAVAVGSSAWTAPAWATRDEDDPLTPTLFGTAALNAASKGGAVIGNSVFTSSRFTVSPNILRIGEFDLTTATMKVNDLPIPCTGGQKLAADGRYLYIGPAGSEYIWRFDPRTGDLVAWCKAGTPATWYWDMTMHGEHLYIGTYPDCTVSRIRLSDATIERYGRISTSNYAAAVAVDDQFVYGGSAAPGSLLVWPKEGGGTPTNFTSLLSASPVGVIDIVVKDSVLYINSGRQVITFRNDGTGRVSRDIPAEERYADMLAIGADGKVYTQTRLTSSLYEVTADGLVKVGQPIVNATVEDTALHAMPDGTFVGVSNIGHIWRMAPSGPATVWQAATTDYGYPEQVQSMMLHTRGTIWVGGHFATTVHRTENGSKVRFDVNGEPKSMAEGRDGTVYLGLYPSTQVAAVDPASYQVRTLGTIGNEQLRPKRIHVDDARNQLLVVSSAALTKYAGALTFIDLTTNTFDTHKEYLPDQGVMDLAVRGTTAYIVGDAYGEGTPGPLRPTAQVAAVDIVSRQLLWREELRPDWVSYEAVYVLGNLLYVLGRRPHGAWLAYDLTSRTVVMEGNIGGYGQLNGFDGRVFAAVNASATTQDIYELPTTPGGEAKLRYDNVARGWFNNPYLNFTPSNKATWGLVGTELARLPIPKA